MAFDGNLVGHGTAGTKNGGFHTKEASSKIFEFVDTGIFSKNVIPQRGILHEIQHGRGRTGNCV
jgi:hypothetical protein